MKTNTLYSSRFSRELAFSFTFCLEVNKNTKITENLWRNFWRDKWRSVFDVVQNFRYRPTCFLYLTQNKYYCYCIVNDPLRGWGVHKLRWHEKVGRYLVKNFHFLSSFKGQRADLTCDVTSIRLQQFEPWPISDEYSNFAGAGAGQVTRFFIKLRQ